MNDTIAINIEPITKIWGYTRSTSKIKSRV